MPASRLDETPGTPPLAGGRRGSGATGSREPSRTRARFPWTLRQPVFCLLLAALPFLTAPGQIISDSELDLSVDPVHFLASVLTLWNPVQFGQLRDQVVGYLFPMGPFFALGRLAAVPPWVTQRLWIGAVLIAAFTGTVRLAGRLGIGTPRTRLVAGLGYALSPVALGMLGELSAEFLPAAMLPWILLPLATANAANANAANANAANANAANAHRARAAARSALAVALCGGVNGAATAAVLVPAVLYILTLRNRPDARLRLLAWWLAAVVLATCWWSIPLLLQSRYGVSFIPYTESAAVTTATTSLDNILRGTENWIGSLVVNGQPWWPMAYRIATQALPTLLTGLVAALGLAGLVRREMPSRSFLLGSVLAGVAIIAAGYTSSLGNPLAGPIGDVINGPASAFRNLWKFDPLIRLPVALGLAHLLAAARAPRQRITLVAAAVAGVGGLAVPAYLSGLAAAGSFGQIPSYWVAAADWLNAHAGRQAVLLAPGAPFGQYTWGSPLNEVLQPLTSADWAERDLSLIGSPGNERLLDAIDQQMAAGEGSAGLTQVIARMGVRYVVVRDDLSRSVLEGTWPARVNQALATSPGITEVAEFGPPVGSFGADDAVTNFDPPYPAVQIYQVAGAEPVATVQPAAGTLRLYGAPEALLTLADQGLLADRPVLLNDDGRGLPVAGSVVSDALRRRVRNFGELRTSYSPTLTAGQPADTFEAVDDYTEPGWAAYQSVARYIGIKDVTASSSAADIGAIPALWSTARLPYAAVDGNPQTMWESGSWNGPVGQWIQEDFDAPVDPGTISVTFADNALIGPPVTQVTVATAAGTRTDPVKVTGNPQPLRVPPGPSGWLRITVTRLAYPPDPVLGSEVGIVDIAVPGVQASRTILAPSVPGGDPLAVVLAKAQPQASGCMLTSLRWVCSPALVTVTDEEYGFDHSFQEPYPERAVVRGTAILTDASLVDKYARLDLHEPTVTASSTYTPDPQDQPRSAFDDNPVTSWIASPQDPHPTLTIRWGYPRTIRQVSIQRPPGAAGYLQVLVTGVDGSRVQARGAIVTAATAVVRFAPMRATSLTFTFTPVVAPVQISGIAIPGVPFVGTPSGPFALPCGFGPLIALNGTVLPTRVSGTFAALMAEQPLQFTACSQVTVRAGVNRVVEPATDAFDVQDVVLSRGLSAVPPGRTAAAAIVSWTPDLRTLRVSAGTRSYLVVNENFNVGWRAVIGGRTLLPVRLDGWKQAWLLPAGTAGLVTLTYQPETPYRDALLAGLAALALILLLAVRPRRRRTPSGPRAPSRRPSSPALSALATPDSSAPLRSSTSGLRRLFRSVAPIVLAFGLAATGLWLGGYPGAGIVPAAALVFLALTGYRGSPHPSGPRRLGLELLRPWVLGGLLLVASACAAVGEHLVLSGYTGLAVTALVDAIPQVICLIVVGRLVAALIIP